MADGFAVVDPTTAAGSDVLSRCSVTFGARIAHYFAHGDDTMHIHIQIAEYIAIGFLFVAMLGTAAMVLRKAH